MFCDVGLTDSPKICLMCLVYQAILGLGEIDWL